MGGTSDREMMRVVDHTPSIAWTTVTLGCADAGELAVFYLDPFLLPIRQG